LSVDEIVLLGDETPVAELVELQPLIAEAQERGVIRFSELESCLEEIEITKEQVQELHAYLEQPLLVDRWHGVGIEQLAGRPSPDLQPLARHLPHAVINAAVDRKQAVGEDAAHRQQHDRGDHGGDRID